MATFDADAAVGEEVDAVDVEAAVDVFARLDAPGVAGACFAGVLGPAILSFSLG